MPVQSVSMHPPAKAGTNSFLARLRRDDSGFTAVEFALVATPFLMLLFGIMAVGLYFFVQFSLENAVEQASRLIRTGQAQTRNPPMTTAEFKSEVCNRAPSFIDCGGKVRVNVQVFNSFATITPPACTDNSGQLVPDPPTSPVPGQAGEIVFVNVCYEWELAGKIPFLKLGKLDNGAALIQAATTFRTEPYN